MALELKFTASRDIENDYFFMSDSTGDYDATTNTGGYGTPNPARTALVLLPYMLDKTGDSDVVINADSYDEETVTKFQFSIDKTQDRLVQFYCFAVLKETGSESVDDVYYNTGADEIRKKTGAGYDVLTVADLVSETVEYTYEKWIPIPNYSENVRLNIVYKNLVTKRASLAPANQVTKLQENYDELTNRYNHLIYTDAKTNYTRIKSIIDATAEYIKTDVDLT